MKLVLTFLFVFITAGCVGVASRYFFYGISSSPLSFWGRKSWMRKWKLNKGKLIPLTKPNLYERWFKVKYVEKFPTSSTALVFITDGPHLMQFIAIKLGCFAIAFHTEDLWVNFGICLAVYYLGFNLVYRFVK